MRAAGGSLAGGTPSLAGWDTPSSHARPLRKSERVSGTSGGDPLYLYFGLCAMPPAKKRYRQTHAMTSNRRRERWWWR